MTESPIFSYLILLSGFPRVFFSKKLKIPDIKLRYIGFVFVGFRATSAKRKKQIRLITVYGAPFRMAFGLQRFQYTNGIAKYTKKRYVPRAERTYKSLRLICNSWPPKKFQDESLSSPGLISSSRRHAYAYNIVSYNKHKCFKLK